jgi:linoleoyl-CoA desaturase
MQTERVKFPRDRDAEFSKTLNARVNAYFKESGISKHANATMVLKTIILVSLYLVPLGMMLTGVTTTTGEVLASFLIMGVAIAGIGMSVMHDANHGAYSANSKVNDAVGYLLNLIGGSAENWKIQHNILHHTYTNIEGLDADIKTFPMMRFSPFAKRRGVHRWQHIYAWFFYGLMTVSWIFLKDFKQLYDYQQSGMTKSYSTGFLSVAVRILLLKVIYLVVTLALPIIILPLPWYVTLGGFFAMHFVGGLILGMVFQAAHIMEVCDFPLPDADGKMGDGWLVHQLRTTTNFAPDNHIVNWYVGGLNFQVEHHLFPRICHVHYPQIAPIVRDTCREFGVPYNSIPTFTGAVLGHGSMLRELGRRDFAPAA